MDKSKKIKDLSKNTLLFTISSFGTKIVAFFLVPLYTYVLTTSEYGILDLLTTTVQLLIPIFTLNIQDAVLRFSLDKDYRPEDVISVGFKVIGLSSIALGIVLGIMYYAGLISLGGNYFLFVYISYISGTVNNSLSMYLKAKDKVRILAIWGIINTCVTCGLNVLLLIVLSLGVNGYIAAYVSGTIVADIGMFITGKVYQDFRWKVKSADICRTMLFYSIPLVANTIGWWINQASDRYILSFFCGTAVNGIYAVAYKIPSILSAVQAVFYNAWSVSAITEFDKNDEDGFIGGVYSAYSAMSILACSAIMMMNLFIAQILYSKDFFQAWRCVPLLLVGTVFNGLGLFNGCIFTAVKKTKEISVTTVLGAAINTVFNFALIPFLGSQGAAAATLTGYFSIWLIRTIRMRKIITMKMNWGSQIKCMLILFAQCIVATLFGGFIYQIPFIIGIIVIQRKLINGIIQKILRIILK